MSDLTPIVSRPEELDERTAREARHQVLIELLAAYADRELPAETTSQIDAHLVGCARCRTELAIHQAVRARLGVEPPVAASPALRERIAAAVGAAALPLVPSDTVDASAKAPWARRPTTWIATGAALVLTLVTGVNVVRHAANVGDAPVLAPLAVAVTSVPLLDDVLVDYRRVTAGDLPGRARDLEVVAGAVPFAVEPLRTPGLRLLAAWTTDLGGEPAAVLAYRWDDRIIVEYLVPEMRFFRHSAIRMAVMDGRALIASAGAQGLVAWPTRAAGAILISDIAPSRLASVIAPELLAKTARRGAE